MYKKVVRTLIVVGVIGYVVYKAYEYFVNKNQEEDEDFIEDEGLESGAEESLVDKIKAAAQRVLG